MTEIWLFYHFADLAAKCLFWPILGSFLGGLTPKCSRMLSRPERHILGRKHAFWHRPDRSRNTTWARAEESKKKEKKRKSDIWQVTYLPRPPTLRYLHQSCIVGCSPRRSQPCQVLSKSVQGFCLSEGSKSAIFLCLALWLTHVQQVRASVYFIHVWSPCYTRAICERFRDKELIYKVLYKFSCLLFYFTYLH